MEFIAKLVLSHLLNSVDIHKALAILIPLFDHMFLQLVDNNTLFIYCPYGIL